MLVTMKEILDRASEENYGVAAPNIFSSLDARAFVEAAEEANAPLILDIAFMIHDKYHIGYFAKELARNSSVPVAINLDHGSCMRDVYEAIQAGFTSVMYDRSTLPFEEGAKEVKATVEIAHSVGLSVEAELGHVGEANNYEIDKDAALTDPEEAAKFVEITGVDCLAVSIGSAHGIYPEGVVPKLDLERLEAVKKSTNNLPLVLHGSSGTTDEDLLKACKMGINKINICGELLEAEIEALKNYDFSGGKAYDIYTVASRALKTKLKEKIKLYGSWGKAWTAAPKGLDKRENTMEEH